MTARLKTPPPSSRPDLENFKKIAAEISEERGPTTLLVLVAREDVPGSWDLVFSAPWLDPEIQRPDLAFIVDKVRKHLTTPEMVQLARIVLLQPDEAWVQEVLGLGLA